MIELSEKLASPATADIAAQSITILGPAAVGLDTFSHTFCANAA
jgi:hypothetical protein